MARKTTQGTTTREKADTFETTSPLLSALYEEIQTLSKKKPDGTLNPSKIKLINRLLSDIQELLKDEPDIKYLDLIEDEDLPQYSDVVLILSQYSASMNKFEERYYGWDGAEHRWFTE